MYTYLFGLWATLKTLHLSKLASSKLQVLDVSFLFLCFPSDSPFFGNVNLPNFLCHIHVYANVLTL